MQESGLFLKGFIHLFERQIWGRWTSLLSPRFISQVLAASQTKTRIQELLPVFSCGWLESKCLDCHRLTPRMPLWEDGASVENAALEPRLCHVTWASRTWQLNSLCHGNLPRKMFLWRLCLSTFSPLNDDSISWQGFCSRCPCMASHSWQASACLPATLVCEMHCIHLLS